MATIKKFADQGEKTGWTYIELSSSQAQKLKKGKVGFRVKGSLDACKFEKVSLLPMGDGNFILPVNAKMRKATGKSHGHKIKVVLEVDSRQINMSRDLMDCLNDEPTALEFFKTLPGSHQRYFSKWIEDAKTSSTKTKRIVMAVTALSQKQGYGEMIRANRKEIS